MKAPLLHVGEPSKAGSQNRAIRLGSMMRGATRVAAFYGAGMLVAIVSTTVVAQPPQSCACKFVGEWSYNGGTTTVNRDGTANPHCPSCVEIQTWTCQGNIYLFSNGGTPGEFTGTLIDAYHMQGPTWAATRLSGGSCSSSSDRKPPAPPSADQAPPKPTAPSYCLTAPISHELNNIIGPGLCKNNVHAWVTSVKSTHKPGCDKFGVNYTYFDPEFKTTKSSSTAVNPIDTCGGPATNIMQQ